MAPNHRLANRALSLVCLVGLCHLVADVGHIENMSAPRARAQDALWAMRIKAAIDKGAGLLKTYSGDGGLGWIKRPASWALRGWALLESGVPTGDPAVKKLAAYVRQEVPEMDRVYDLALSVIFLDK